MIKHNSKGKANTNRQLCGDPSLLEILQSQLNRPHLVANLTLKNKLKRNGESEYLQNPCVKRPNSSKMEKKSATHNITA